jgi:hypothetical protein
MADVADNDLLDYEEEDQVRKFKRSNSGTHVSNECRRSFLFELLNQTNLKIGF